MKTLLIGAGAIGGTLAVCMNSAGYDVDILEANDAIRDEIRAKGLHLTGFKGSIRVFPVVYGSAEEIKEKYDVAIIAVKYLSLIPAAKAILPLIKEESLVVGMQNGICTGELASVVGEDRTAGCMIGFGATKKSTTEIEMTSGGEMYIGMPGGRHPVILDKVCRMYNSVLPTKVTEELLERQFSKLIINCCINATAAITGKTLGEMLGDVRAQDLFLAIAREGMTIAGKMGVTVPKYGKLLDYRLLMLGSGKAYNSLCKAIVRLVGNGKYASVRPSTLQSLERGEKTEIDIFNGWLAKKAAQYDIPAPVNTKLTEMIRQIENGERKMSMDNLDEFKGMI